MRIHLAREQRSTNKNKWQIALKKITIDYVEQIPIAMISSMQEYNYIIDYIYSYSPLKLNNSASDN